jgi:hypothetical protein
LIGFEDDSRPLKRPTLIRSQIGDPFIPIYLVHRSPMIFVHSDELPSRDVPSKIHQHTTATAINSIIRSTIANLRNFDLFCGDQLLKEETKSVDINPYFELPLVVRHVRLKVSSITPAFFYASPYYNGVCPMSNVEPLLSEVKAALSSIFRVTHSKIVVSLPGQSLNDDVQLDLSRIYSVSIMKEAAIFTLHFLPVGRASNTTKLVYDLSCDVTIWRYMTPFQAKTKLKGPLRLFD